MNSDPSFITSFFSALSFMFNRGIRITEIKEAIAQGKVIEDYADDKYSASCLIAGFTIDNRPLHIQCSYPSRPLIKIITIYQPNREHWNNNFTQRIN